MTQFQPIIPATTDSSTRIASTNEVLAVQSSTAVVDVCPAAKIREEPKTIGPYIVEHEIGRGAMGAVYQATHSKLKRKVALKILPDTFTTQPRRLERFHREMEAVGRLDHPNIIRATDAGEIEGVHYLAMELATGVDLEQVRLHVRSIDLAAACEAVRQTALGLQHIHDNKLVHRDIKPSNLFLSDSGVIKILDLGIARLRQQEGATNLTMVGGMMGTPDFMAPEQVQSESVDIRADIYSLGCTLYTLLANRPPFAGPDYDTHAAKIVAHAKDAPPPLRSLRPNLPKELEKVISRMMAKGPADRFQAPCEVAEALSKLADAGQLVVLASQVIGENANDGQVHKAPLVPARGERKRAASKRGSNSWVRWAIITSVVAALLTTFAVVHWPRNRSSQTNPLDILTRPSDGNKVLESLATKSLDEVSVDTRSIRENSNRIADAGEAITRNTERIVESLDEIRDSLNTGEGEIVPNPQTIGEVYRNARVYEQQDKYSLARQHYLRLFHMETEYVDVHRSFQRFLKLQEGVSGAREIYRNLPGTETKSSVRALATALLCERPERIRRLTTLVELDPSFGPAFYELSHCWSPAMVGSQTLADKARENELLQEFMQLNQKGGVLHYYLDQSAAAEMIESAEQRLVALTSSNVAAHTQPVTLTTRKHQAAWTLMFNVAEQTREIMFRLNSADPFQSTGFLNQMHPETGSPIPQPCASIPVTTNECVIEVKYTDIRGNSRGPFTFPFSPEHETVKAAKRFLELTKNSWVQFGSGDNDDKLYFSHLAVQKEAIAEVRYALDHDQPTIVKQLPALESGDARSLYVMVPGNTEFAVVEIEFTDGTTSEIVRFDRPVR